MVRSRQFNIASLVASLPSVSRVGTEPSMAGWDPAGRDVVPRTRAGADGVRAPGALPGQILNAPQ